ncbi:MAG TPA: hypothetical protein VGM60_14625 [Pseudonocardia sp.]|jgi:hypothetical protein|uniref:hypothetical protein n=1 Tax=Pseudonocardia sp. TaxID=60912 RepID=UPI002F42E67B
MIFRERNSLPTTGEIRVARSRVDMIVAPVLRQLRTGLFFWLGAADLVVTVIKSRSARVGRDDPEAAIQRAATAIAERGEQRYARVRSFPRVQRALAGLDTARRNVTSETGRAVDEAHDSVEESLARIEIASRSVVDLAAARARDAVRALRPDQPRTTEKSVSEHR